MFDVSETALQNKVAPKNLRVKHERSDGNCMFAVLATHMQAATLQAAPVTAADVRAEIVTYIRANPQMVSLIMHYAKLLQVQLNFFALLTSLYPIRPFH